MSNQAMLPLETEPQASLLREHLREVFDSHAFKGSKRSQQFLQYIVEKALARQTEELKERSLGVALFGRSPSYDTGEDAVVRVTASDVRKRLQQYYSEHPSTVRIDLIAGSYTPEFRYLPIPVSTLSDPAAGSNTSWARTGALLVLIAGAALGVVWFMKADPASLREALPWSALLQDGRQLQLVLADPDISALQELTGSEITLADYANRRYLPNPEAYSADMQRTFKLLRGANVAAADAGIVGMVSRLAASGSVRLKINTARSLQLSAFRTDDDFMILGSYRSNPWGRLFEDQLDFDFVRDPKTNRETIRNKKTQKGELPLYVPTAGGWDAGDAYAVIALVENPNQAGKVLIVAGTNAEATEAAGKFLSNPAELTRQLQANGIEAGGPATPFEILLRVRTMAGSSRTLEAVAFHRLASRAAR
jgi:hypothetical protein